MKFLLTSYSSENADGTAEYALVDITPERAADLLAHRTIATQVKAARADFVDLRFWGEADAWLSQDGGQGVPAADPDEDLESWLQGAIGQDLYDRLIRENVIEAPDGFEVPAYFRADVELEFLLVDDEECRWTAYLRHTDWKMETTGLPWDRITKASVEQPAAVGEDPARVAEVIEDLKKDSDNAVPDFICPGDDAGPCGAATNKPEADQWIPCSGCGQSFCPKCGEVHRKTACFESGE